MDLIDFTQSKKPTVYLYRGNTRYDITNICDGIQWSGEYQQVSRSLEIEMLYPVHDKNQSVIVPDIGEMITLIVDGEELFRGGVWTRDLLENTEFLKVTCYDALVHITKSTTSYNLKNVTPESTVKRVCNDFNIPYNSIASSGGCTYTDLAFGKNCYDIIMAGYTEASKKTNKKYMPIMREGKLNIIEKGTTRVNFELDSNINVMNVQHTETLDSMINKVIIYDEGGNVINKVENSDWIKVYGLLQGAIQEDKEKDNVSLAKKELKNMERKVQVQALGIVTCITGNAVILKSSHSKAIGLFYIDGDTHSWINNSYEMTLTLNFENLMDEKDVNEETETDTETENNNNTNNNNNNNNTNDTSGTSKGTQVVNVAKKYLGVPYVWGGTTPNGFDCSGLCQYAYKQIGVTIPRTTYEQVKAGSSVSVNSLQPGDLIFFYSGCTHVGMYVGNNQFIHAPKTGDVVKIVDFSSYYKNNFYGARRYV